MRVVTTIILTVLVVLFPDVARGQEAPPKRVVVSPLVYARPGALEENASTETLRRAALEGAASYVAHAGDDFVLVRGEETLSRIRNAPTYAEMLELATGWAQLGIAKYQELESDAAIENLRQAYERYVRIGHDFVAPGQVAEVLRVLSVALLEKGDVQGPLDAMKAMVTLDPNLAIQRGVYPEEVVQFYETARLELERDIRDRGPETAQVERLAQFVGADFVIVLSVLPAADGLEVVSWLYDASEGQYTEQESLTLQQRESAAIEAAANRLASRHIACLVEPEPQADTSAIPESTGEGPFALQLNLNYASFLSFPELDSPRGLVEPFGLVGATIGAGLFVTREFAFLAMFQFLNSTTEYGHLVEPGFTTLRWFLGGELGIGFGPLRLGLGTTAEIAYVSTINVCVDDPVDEFQDPCADPQPLDGGPRVLFGINARPRLSVRVLPSMELYVAGGTSFYFAPAELTDLNLLTGGEAGLQYRF